MIVLDEQLSADLFISEITRWYPGRVDTIQNLRPNTVIKDDNIPALLRSVSSPTFVTINVFDFWRKVQPHQDYCVVTIDLSQSAASPLPTILRNLFKKPQFSTKAARMGHVIRVQQEKIRFYSFDRRITTISDK